MCEKEGRVVWRAPATMKEQSIARRQGLALDEQLVEGGMSAVRALRAEDHLGVAGQAQAPTPSSAICDAQKPDFHVVIRHYDYVCRQQHTVTVAAKPYLVLMEGDLPSGL
jgi:hypothetical protein